MNKTIGEAEAFIAALLGRGVPNGDRRRSSARRPRRWRDDRVGAAARRIGICAQNVHEEESGAFTGEVSIPMLADLGVAGSIVGHSERRRLFDETDEALARKVPALLAAEMLAILCCGETESERDAGETEAVLRRQLEADLAEVADDDLGRVVIAYEPIWAIGTGRTATPEQAAGGVRVHPRADRGSLRRRRRGDPDRLRRLGEAGERGRAVRARRRRRRTGRRRRARPRRLRRDLQGRGVRRSEAKPSRAAVRASVTSEGPIRSRCPRSRW